MEYLENYIFQEKALVSGYLNNESLTDTVFIKNPFIKNSIMYKTGDLCTLLETNEIKYLERIDNQIKIRGQRIELRRN